MNCEKLVSLMAEEIGWMLLDDVTPETVRAPGRACCYLRRYLALELGLRSEKEVHLGQGSVADVLSPIQLDSQWLTNAPAQHWALYNNQRPEQPLVQPRVRHILPPDVPHFIGREREFDQLESALTIDHVAIVGPTGIGKTALALALAHKVAPHYPDGQFHLPAIHGGFLYSAEGLMIEILRTIQPEYTGMGSDDDIRNEYEAVLSDRHVLIVLDDAYSADLLNALIPPATCRLIVTSRDLVECPGMSVFQLGPLELDKAKDLALTLAPRLGSDELVLSLVEACCCVPSVLCLAARYVNQYPNVDAEVLIAEWHDEYGHLHRRLTEEANSTLDSKVLAAAFDQLEAFKDSMISRLPLGTRRLLVALSAFVGDFDFAAGRYVAGDDLDSYMDQLVALGIVTVHARNGSYSVSHTGKRWVLNCRKTSSDHYGFALARHSAYFCRKLELVSDLFVQSSLHRGRALAIYDQHADEISRGFSWAQEHRDRNKSAARLCVEFAINGRDIWQPRMPDDEWAQWLGAALHSAQDWGGATEEAMIRVLAAETHAMYAETDSALSQLLDLSRLVGEGLNPAWAGPVLYLRGAFCVRNHQVEKGLRLFKRALSKAQDSGNRGLEGHIVKHLGRMYSSYQHNWVLALQYFRRALKIAREIGDQRAEIEIHSSIRLCLQMTGDEEAALVSLEQALVVADALGDNDLSANVLLELASQLAQFANRRDEAVVHLRRAKSLLKGTRYVGTRSIFAEIFEALGLGDVWSASD